MSREYFEKKKYEILEKNISENDKIRELERLAREENDRIKSYEKNILGILTLIVLLLIITVSLICAIFDINTYVASDLVIIFIGFSYLLYRIYKIIKNKLNQRYWKTLVDFEIKDLQTMCDELSESISGDLKKKRRKVKMKRFSAILGIFLPWLLFVFLYLFFIEIFSRMDFITELFIIVFTLDMFEPKIFGKIIDEISIYKYYVITKFAKELVERIDNYC